MAAGSRGQTSHGPFLLCQAFGRGCWPGRGGSIVNVASDRRACGVADRAAYNASKHGLVGLTRTLAAEWGGRGVRVNAVCPSWVKTEMDVATGEAGVHRQRHRRAGADGAALPRPTTSPRRSPSWPTRSRAASSTG
jgi:NAD(P)-dependent dehydrogenase (short-subunit alcohol dehydrogenase family)